VDLKGKHEPEKHMEMMIAGGEIPSQQKETVIQFEGTKIGTPKGGKKRQYSEKSKGVFGKGRGETLEKSPFPGEKAF